MTDATDAPEFGADPVSQEAREARPVSLPKTQFQKIIAWVRLGLSAGIVLSVGVWGYQLLKQDASGVPIVHASEGPMRIAPENPGGDVADNMGLAVNAVLSLSGAEPASDVVVLAPQVQAFEEGDLIVQSDAEAGEVYSETFSKNASDAPMPLLAATQQPVSAFDLMADSKAAALAEREGTTETVAELITIPANVPGLSKSLVPPSRPAAMEQRVAVAAPEAAPTTAAAPAGSVPRSTVEKGAALVQLGAFPTAAIAEAEWLRLTRAFPAFMQGKGLIIEQTVNAGREFHRLRASGFTDIADARRFCTLMEAEKVGCIPTTAN